MKLKLNGLIAVLLSLSLLFVACGENGDVDSMTEGLTESTEATDALTEETDALTEATDVLTEASEEQESESIIETSPTEANNTEIEIEDETTESVSEAFSYERGKEIVFGKFKDEPVKWRILAKDNGRILIITKELVGYMSFKEETIASGSTWKNSSIREWLRTIFYAEAFTANEKQAILTTETFDPWPTEEYVEDTLFLLSWDQVKKYFTSEQDRIAFFADYVYKELDSSKRKLNGWWLIDSYTSTLYKESILKTGEHHDGPRTNEKEGVRPAAWIDISKLS